MLLFYIPCSSTEEAEKIAASVIESKVAACANIIPGVSSMYEWDGKLQKEQESILLLKCKAENKNCLEQQVSEIHSYECPCILSLKPETVNQPFLNWIRES